jgi:hypothetical protein
VEHRKRWPASPSIARRRSWPPARAERLRPESSISAPDGAGRARCFRSALPWDRIDLVFSIEAAFHFEDKAAILEEAGRRRVRLVTMLEICVEDSAVVDDPLLTPSLHNAWSSRQYENALATAGFGRVEIEDIGDRVFAGFLDYLESLDAGAYGGRRAILEQLRRATRSLVLAAAGERVRYVLLTAAEK